MNVVSVDSGKVHIADPTCVHPFPKYSTPAMRFLKFRFTDAPVTCINCVLLDQRAATVEQKNDQPTHVSRLDNGTPTPIESATRDDDNEGAGAMNITLGSGKAVHYVANPVEGYRETPECGGNRAAERYMTTTRDVTCKRCLKIMDAEKAAEAEGAQDIAEAVPTHVSSLVESATHDDDNNDGGDNMAAKKLKLKDVRGDVRIGAVPGADAIHALRNAVDERGRNLAMCRVQTKNPIQLWGPAMEQKPELELCAGCSKVVPTGEVVVTEEPVKVPGLDVTVNQKVITPVEGTDKGENTMPAAAKKTAAAPPTQDVDALISDVHEAVDSIKGAADAETVESYAADAEEIIKTLPTKHRNTLRTAVSDAKKAKLTELNPEAAQDAQPAAAAPAKKTASKAVAKKAAAAPAEVAEDFNKFDGVPELVKDGVKSFKEGMALGLKLGNVGEKVARIMLEMRLRIPNPDAAKLPDLTAARKTTKNAAGKVYDDVRKTIADDDVDGLSAYNSLQRATQNKATDILCDWLDSFDGGDADESRNTLEALFPGAVKKLDENAKLRADLKAEGVSEDDADFPAELLPSEAIRELYADNGVTLPRYGRTELARIDRRVKKLQDTTKELEALKDDDKADASKVEELENVVKELKAEIPAEILEEKGQVKEKTDAERTAEALEAVKAQLEKAGKRFSKVKAANEKRRAKAELYNIIRSAADTFDLDLSALVTSDDEE